MSSRREFLALGVAALPAAAAAAPAASQSCPIDERISLDGEWLFRLDSQPETAWRTVRVPHTWQIEPDNAEYMGAAWYKRTFDAPLAWRDCAVRVEFEAVFHTAKVWINGKEAGEHKGKGYTAFTVDAVPHLKFGGSNTLLVRADNSFDETMLPRGRSSDWAHDGGIYRPVHLLVTPKVFIERIAIDATPELPRGGAGLEIAVEIRNSSTAAWSGRADLQVIDEETGLAAAITPTTVEAAAIQPGSQGLARLTAKMGEATLWHFDHPHLYRFVVRLANGHTAETTFGIRKIETRDGAFYLNGEPVRLMGLERMAGSNPEFGMAEPMEWIAHDHADMKELNCVYTRVHWQQDRRVLDWCDRHGMLIQTEVPTWGGQTFAGMEREPSVAIMNNGLEQLREMIARDRNHPCIFSWGVCNEIGGQNAPAYEFARRMYEEAKRLDPQRLVTYASNSLQTTPGKDVSGLMDYVMWNEYYESWYKGTPADMGRNLDEIHAAFPGKAIVISEYGYCACTPERPEGDARRIEVLRSHDAVFRDRKWVAGLIFFCYNDYRTHIGDKGTGVMKQRVHGVVDLYGARKPSWEVARRESSPVERVIVTGNPADLKITVKARETVPAYPLRGYSLRGVAYGFGDIPLERVAVETADLLPGATATASMKFTQPGISRIQVDVIRPTGFSAWTETWHY
jgi:beta-galactosidase